MHDPEGGVGKRLTFELLIPRNSRLPHVFQPTEATGMKVKIDPLERAIMGL